jgi:hypothetical protein
MSITISQNTNAQNFGGGTTATISFVSAPTVGHAVIVVVAARGGQAVTGVADNNGNGAYTRAVANLSNISANGVAEIWYLPSIATSSGTFTVTVTVGSAQSGGWYVGLLEVSGLAATPIDQTGSAQDPSGSSTSATATGTSANASANDLVVGALALASFHNAAVTLSNPANTGYTTLFNGDFATDSDSTLAGAYKIVTSTETSSVNWTWTGGDGFAAVLATFKASGAANTATIAWIT